MYQAYSGCTSLFIIPFASIEKRGAADTCVGCSEHKPASMQDAELGEEKGHTGELQSTADMWSSAGGSMDVDSLTTGMSKLSSCDSTVPNVATFGRKNKQKAFG